MRENQDLVTILIPELQKLFEDTPLRNDRISSVRYED